MGGEAWGGATFQPEPLKDAAWGLLEPGPWHPGLRELRVYTCVLEQTEDIRQGMFGGGGPGSCSIIQLLRLNMLHIWWPRNRL